MSTDQEWYWFRLFCIALLAMPLIGFHLPASMDGRDGQIKSDVADRFLAGNLFDTHGNAPQQKLT